MKDHGVFGKLSEVPRGFNIGYSWGMVLTGWVGNDSGHMKECRFLQVNEEATTGHT